MPWSQGIRALGGDPQHRWCMRWHAESIEPVHARTFAVAEETLVTVVVTPDASVVVVVVTVVVGVGYIDQTTRNQGECAHAQSMQIVVVSATDKS